MSRFLVGDELGRAINEILGEERCSCAVAFWGKGALKKLANRGNLSRLICNLQSGGTNPFEIEKIPKDRIKQCDTLHAKVYVGKNRAVISSANVSSNGLGFEDVEQAHWIEAGVVLYETSDALKWFDELWETSQEITDDDLKQAKINWKKRQRSKPSLLSFADFDVDQENIPLLYWVAKSEWEHNGDAIKKQLGADDDQTQKLIDESLEVERFDRDAMRAGTWIVVWEVKQNGLPKRQPAPYWFFTSRLVERAFRYKGERIYRDAVLKADNPPAVPFNLREPRVGLHPVSLTPA